MSTNKKEDIRVGRSDPMLKRDDSFPRNEMFYNILTTIRTLQIKQNSSMAGAGGVVIETSRQERGGGGPERMMYMRIGGMEGRAREDVLGPGQGGRSGQHEALASCA